MADWLVLQRAQSLLAAMQPRSKESATGRSWRCCSGARCPLEICWAAVEQIQQRDCRCVVADLVGKGGRVRGTSR
jgi:hypothetical protein